MGRILDLVDARQRKDVDELLQKVAELDPRRRSKAKTPAPNVEETDVQSPEEDQGDRGGRGAVERRSRWSRRHNLPVGRYRGSPT
jgi:hypothetical protein